MSDTDRILGRLEEFKDQTEKRLDRIEEKLDKVCLRKPRKTIQWKIGLGALLVAVVAAVKECVK